MASSLANENEAGAARFEAAALPFMDALYKQALHLTRRPEDADDMVQETYLRAYRTFSSFKEGKNCKAWLFTILYSIFVNKYRKERREPIPSRLTNWKKRSTAHWQTAIGRQIS